MQISLDDWAKYRNTLSKLSQAAADDFRDHFLKTENGLASVSRDEVIEYAHALITKYGEGSSELACQMYDAIADISNVNVAAAVPAETATMNETAKAINGAFKQSPSGQLVDSVIQRLVKQAAADTTLQNAERDKAQFAWIPSGDTCAFCITLASRGWQNISKKSLRNGHAEHIHAHCDCQYAIRFDKKTNVEGYDPEEYAEMYYSESGKPQDRINAMRRKHYAENKDVINARKRELYEQGRQLIYDNGNIIKVKNDILTTLATESKYGIHISENALVKKIGLNNIEKAIDTSLKAIGNYNPNNLPQIFILSAEEMGETTFASYNFVKNQMFLADILGNKAETKKMQNIFGFANPNDPTSTTKHEFLHWDDAIKYIKENNSMYDIEQNKKYLQYLQNRAIMELEKEGINAQNVRKICRYANDAYQANDYDEVYTELRVLRMG